jgi:ElaB/YqjD/DUF883 family membrane-anchored ribosome-binding protein
MTTTHKTGTSSMASLSDSASQGVSRVLGDAQRAAQPAFDAVTQGVDDLRHNAVPALREMASDAEDMARSRLRAARDGAVHMRDAGVGYARGHPVQTLLMAAGIGVAVVLALSLLSGRDRSR